MSTTELASNRGAFRIARRKMIEEQLKKRGLSDPRVLEAMETVPRHFFVDEALAAQSYGDSPLPIGDGQTISQPYIVAFMTEALRLKPGDRVLEIGSGSGYQTAVLASLAAFVYAVERLESLYQKGLKNLARLNIDNVQHKLADGTLGWPEVGPFDAILVAAGGPRIPLPLIDQLAPGGRLIIPVGASSESQKLTLAVKEQDGSVRREILSACRFVALVGKHGW